MLLVFTEEPRVLGAHSDPWALAVPPPTHEGELPLQFNYFGSWYRAGTRAAARLFLSPDPAQFSRPCPPWQPPRGLS